jgi:hypothetical protein
MSHFSDNLKEVQPDFSTISRVDLLKAEAERAYNDGAKLITVPYQSKNPNRRDWNQERWSLSTP